MSYQPFPTTAVSPLTNADLRAAPLPVSGTVTANINGTVPVSGTFWQPTQPVSIASMPTTPVTGTFWQATQPVSIAATVAVSGPLTDTQLRASAVPVSGTFFQATQPVSLAALPALATGANSIGNIGTVATLTSITNAVTITPPTLTKATQGATGFSTQDLKDAGRAIVNAATAIAGVTAVTTEALLSLNVSRDGAVVAAVTTISATAGKRYRITGLIASVRSSSAAVLSGRVALRLNPSGAVTATSPVIAIASMTQQAAALAEAGDTCVIAFPDGIEISGTMQVGLSQICSAITGVVYASLIGYEY